MKIFIILCATITLVICGFEDFKKIKNITKYDDSCTLMLLNSIHNDYAYVKCGVKDGITGEDKCWLRYKIMSIDIGDHFDKWFVSNKYKSFEMTKIVIKFCDQIRKYNEMNINDTNIEFLMEFGKDIMKPSFKDMKLDYLFTKMFLVDKLFKFNDSKQKQEVISDLYELAKKLTDL